ncbi:MAG: right-handed parallel beta-helix repeat-containing protein, partial [Bacteroidota bacterium]|nr:right-handed parallel beta-helix repeat-containing protein [Bacteroidota bacterium]
MRTLKHALSSVAVLLTIVCAVIPARAQLSGNYSIGSGGDYSSFASALAALGSQGVSGPVHFAVHAGTYNEYVFVGEFSGVSATNTVTFDGGSGNAATRVLTYAITWNYGAVLTLDGADYVRFRNLTIASTGPSYGFAVKFANAADHNEISDCVITTPANTASTYHRGIVTASLTSSPSYGDHGSYNLIRDNVIESGYYGIQWYGASSSDYTVSRENHFIGNTVKDFHYYGIYMGGGGAQVLRGNSVVQRSSGAFSTSGGYGIYMNYCNDGPEVSGNYCRTASNALRLYNHNRYASSPAVRACAYNNMLISDGTGTAYGMYVYYCQNTDVYFNSCRAASATGTVYGIYAGGSSSSDVRIVNNIVGCETSGTLRPVYVSSTSAFTAFDYNILYSGGTPSAESWLWESTTYASLAAMQAAVPGYHQHSQDADPFWVAADNLHSTSPYA